MKTLKVLFAVVLSLFMAMSAAAQVKKAPVKKKPVVTKKVVQKKTTAVKPVVPQKIPGIRIKLTTDSGVMVIRLYDSTP